MNSPGLRIVPLQADQAQTLADLARLIWQQHYPGIISQAQIDYMLHQRYGLELILQQLGETGHGWSVANTEGAMRGFCHCLLASGTRPVKIDKLYVHPDYQRQGIGAALLAQVEDQSRAHGAHTISLRTNQRNHVALAAYRKYGFDIVSEAITDIGGGFRMEDYVLEKRLDESAVGIREEKKPFR